MPSRTRPSSQTRTSPPPRRPGARTRPICSPSSRILPSRLPLTPLVSSGMTKGQKIGVIVPIFNEEENLPELKRRLSAVLDATKLDYEVILVDDGSKDRSLAIMREYNAKDPRWKALALSRNFSHGAACTAGLDYIDADAVVFLDADLQDPPELIPEFIKKWREGYAVVFGARTGRPESWIR